jgi:hypothetical protein
MNKAKLKSYAPQARKDFIAAVTARANLLGLSNKAGKLEVAASLPQGDVTVIAGQAWPVKVHGQRDQLVIRIQRDGFAQTMEAVAYTWFNRFAALRYMELHDYLGHGHRALSSTAGTLPDILTHAADLAQSGSLPGLKAGKVTEMKLAGNRDGELYRLLLVAQCNALSNAMPFLFERIDDETELLLPDNLLRTDSVIAKLVAAIDEEDWKEVEIIGWLYQFYISEKKDDVIGKVVKSEDIPAATQLFTPNWIVEYLVQNSVGRLWLMANSASTLKAQWPYYIEPTQQTPEVQAQLDALIQTRMDEDGGSLNPESITLLDPACGSGHILVVAYEVLKAIYLERGYQPRAIPRLILEKNLFGLDIDDRAAQMAGFALLMKARADDRRLFNEPIRLNVRALQESKGLDADVLTRALQTVLLPLPLGDGTGEGCPRVNDFSDNDLFPDTRPQISLGESSSLDTSDDPLRPAIAGLIATFAHAKTFGSLIQISSQCNEYMRELLLIVKQALKNGDLYAKAAAQDLWPLVAQAQVLGMQFDAVVANPPYMGNKALCSELKIYLAETFPSYEWDLFSAFMARNVGYTRSGGFTGFVSSFVWMYISTYESVRNLVNDECTLESLIQLDYDAYEDAKAHLCAFVIRKFPMKEFIGTFINLEGFKGGASQSPKALEAIRDDSVAWRFSASSSQFQRIPGKPIAFWIHEAVSKAFVGTPPFSERCFSVKGLDTCDNATFVRRWFEVSLSNIGFDVDNVSKTEDCVKWYPYSKGGFYRKWFGNNEFVVDWENNGEVLRSLRDQLGKMKAFPRSIHRYFTKGINFSAITSSDFSCRLMENSIFGGGGNAVFSEETSLTLGFLNSSLVSLMTKALNPTLNILVGDILRLPYKYEFQSRDAIVSNVDALIDLTKSDWAQVETSWEFRKLSWVCTDSDFGNLADAWLQWELQCASNLSRVAARETENNRLFLAEYELGEVISPEVEQRRIPFVRAARQKDCQRLMSYAIGCMMGRYSLDAPGLIYAHAGNIGFDASLYTTFPADADGIVPLTDELWFEDDAASRIREFLLAVWGADTLAENMAWMAASLGTKSSETPDEIIRRYLADKFYKDHLQTYKKRPIYWLFSSGKQGAFQALVYLHRYHGGTLSRLRAEYVVPLTGKIQSRIDMLQKDAAAAFSTAARNKLAKEVEKLKKKHVELLAYDERLRHHADMRITLDLDDGVKVNYGRFGDLLSEVKAVTGGAGDE